ncbi:glycosyltransferase family 2 protein [Marinobacter oulmenensis]|uniref:Glycosyltransferase involved in cell wall biosynthesis n=1 Tax=Marinobacter oulmenensis TaxID=643747 RepID=A0A840U6X1_9GAMM|nr:glycosyltransferase family 2 protein [Marinobacter oulmenensis]MBB5320692.1 glycosyltransferase involved in cell wall biosynthesis [Marinobacter oulmenensis]
MRTVTIIIPTYNRLQDLLLTLPQVVAIMDENCELIVFDQSNSYAPEEYQQQLDGILGRVNARYVHCRIPSLPLAWNTAAKLATGEIVLFLDDDIDIHDNLIDIHRQHYEEKPDIVGVAGAYYAGSENRPWIPSERNGRAVTLAGVNCSFRRQVFLDAGSVSSFIKPFAPIDWEIAEHVSDHFGRLAVGADARVFHRAPAEGGCENQAARGIDWYYGSYHNHILWALHRRYPQKLIHFPRHFYVLMKYCLPGRQLLLTKAYWTGAVIRALKDAGRTYRQDGKKRRHDTITDSDAYRIVAQYQHQSS